MRVLISVKANENRKDSVSEEENEGRGGRGVSSSYNIQIRVCHGEVLEKKAALNRMGSGEQSRP